VRLAVDTGGTFTDLVIEDEDGQYATYKASTVPEDPVQGILDVLDVAARDRNVARRMLLGDSSMLIHGTTRSLNAVLTNATAKTAFLTTLGHPDVLLLREGGRTDIFNLGLPYPEPYVPRSLTFEVAERIGASGEVVRPLDVEDLLKTIDRLRELAIQAVGICFLWSIVNPVHEVQVGALIKDHLPDVAVTLSHQLNPCLREYRRASSTCIDASLKPIMSQYIGDLNDRLRAAGFAGRLLMVSSSGGVLDAADVAAAPIHSLHSGPAMAPVAGLHFARTDTSRETAIIADTGGTSYDVSVVRRGQLLWTRETWIGKPFFGHMTGFPSVDVRSVGAGGGSIAWVDRAGLLHVGPESAGADPGPACYGRRGTNPTVTDACVVLGLIDPDFFLGGRARLEAKLAVAAIENNVAQPLGIGVLEAAAAVLRVATERMVSAIEQITIHEGVDPREAVLVGGGGAAGLNVVAIARRLRCPEVIIPQVGPVLSAAGGVISDLVRSFELTLRTTDRTFDYERVNETLGRLEDRCREFIDGAGAGSISSDISYSVEARYPQQVWELEVPLRTSRLRDQSGLEVLCVDFHRKHRDVFAIADEHSAVEFESWHARARCRLKPSTRTRIVASQRVDAPERREIYLPEFGATVADVWRIDNMPIDDELRGPAVVHTASTTVVIDPGASLRLLATGTLQLKPAAVATADRATSVSEDLASWPDAETSDTLQHSRPVSKEP
jgi:N-methylhydantoinase A